MNRRDSSSDGDGHFDKFDGYFCCETIIKVRSMGSFSYSRVTTHLMAWLLLGSTLVVSDAIGQQDETDNETDTTNQETATLDLPPVPQILDEPRRLDPATLLPEELTQRVTVNFEDTSLREIIRWLKDELNFVVLVETNALAESTINLGEPVSERSDNEPLYLLLNRLRSLRVAWHYSDNVLHITSQSANASRMITQTYNIGDLLDDEYDPEVLEDLITNVIDADSWDVVGGSGVLRTLGDVMFISQTNDVHLRIRGLLTSLRDFARQTYILDPTENQDLKDKLDALVSIDFLETPFEVAMQDLSEISGVKIRLDRLQLASIGLRTRQPFTLELENQKLSLILTAIKADLGLSYIFRDGVIWLTSPQFESTFQKTAVYDVRDLCCDQDESAALRDAIVSQSPDHWSEYGGPSQIEFAKPGVMLVSSSEEVLTGVLELLEMYRTALTTSKIRDRDLEDADEITTVYYRLNSILASGLVSILPELVEPSSWRSDSQPEANGTIRVIQSAPDLENAAGVLILPGSSDADQQSIQMVISRSVLIIEQTRSNHTEIAKLIVRLERGDESWRFEVGGGGGAGMGGGGFGGGLFSVPGSEAPNIGEFQKPDQD